MTPQMRAAQPAGVVDMRETSFGTFPATSEQALSARTSDAPTIRVQTASRAAA